jgi:hypothetical protein
VTANALDLDARYGRTPGRRNRTRWIAIGTAVAFVVVFGAWVIWGGLLGSPAQIETNDTGHSIIDDSTVRVTWELSVAPGSTTSCAVQALNDNFGIVGWKVIDVPASTDRTRSLSADLRTMEPAVSGLIYRCWLT